MMGKAKKRRGLFGLFGKPDGPGEADMAAERVDEAPPAPPQDAAPPQDEAEAALNIVPIYKSELCQMYCRTNGLPPLPEDATFDLTRFHMHGLVPNDETRGLLKGLDSKAAAVQRKWEAADTEPVDAEAVVLTSSDRMRAYLFVFPPMFGGEDLSAEQAKELLDGQKIVFGIDEETLAAAVDGHVTMTLILLAQGTPVQDGQDGQLVDHYNRETGIHLTIKWDNTIDYRDLGWLQTAHEGDVICDILPPTPAVDGMNIHGQEVKGKDGRKAQAPMGSGTALNAEGTALLSKMDGVVTFSGDRFRVDPMLIVEGDVGTAVGNLDMKGDILVKGDIIEGFTVTATGNITVNGGVEGATIKAGGNVQIGLGMNGNSVGSITAGGDVYSKFFENANVWASGTIVCDTIINSTIASENEVLVNTGRGTIIGGQVTALVRVAAISIGNPSNRAMEITLGNTATYLQEKNEAEQERQKEAIHISELEKDIRFLERQIDTPAKKQRVDDLKLKLKVSRIRMKKLDQAYADILEREADIVKCRLQAQVIYPPLQVTMGPAIKMIRKNQYNAMMYFKDGEIHIANV